MTTTTIRIQGTDARFQQFERQCRVTELMLASTLCDRFKIQRTDKHLELIAGWLASARSMGIANHLTSGIQVKVADGAIDEPELAGLEEIKRERLRQIQHLGYTNQTDAQWTQGQLLSAAATYLEAARIQEMFGDDPDATQQAAIVQQLDEVVEKTWPWEETRPNLQQGPIQNIIKAGAMIAAELDRRAQF